MKPGYFLIKHLGFLIPARFDGEKWYHEFGTSFAQPDHKNVVCDKDNKPIAIALDCPVGCSCTTNADGSIHVKCSE